MADQILRMKNTIRQAGKHCGVLATSIDNLRQRQEQGFSAVGLGSDSGLLLRSLHGTLAAVGRDRKLNAALSAE